MSSYDPNQTPSWTPPQAGYGAVPADARPATDGDRWALVALAVGVMTLLSCVPGLNCLAVFAPLAVGITALVKAKTAADPQRARTYGWIATGIGMVILVGLIAIFGLYGAQSHQ